MNKREMARGLRYGCSEPPTQWAGQHVYYITVIGESARAGADALDREADAEERAKTPTLAEQEQMVRFCADGVQAVGCCRDIMLAAAETLHRLAEEGGKIVFASTWPGETDALRLFRSLGVKSRP